MPAKRMTLALVSPSRRMKAARLVPGAAGTAPVPCRRSSSEGWASAATSASFRRPTISEGKPTGAVSAIQAETS
jgi:hypothetical protein